jgi:TolB-like protein
LRYLFEQYAFDTDRRELHRGADVISVAPLVFDLIDYLIRNRDRVISKDELIKMIWNGRIVSDAALTTRLNAARSAIGDSGEEQRLIKTLPRKGFRFVGTIREAQRPASVAVTDTPTQQPKPTLPLPDKPSIAILPFINMSGDPEQDYFADGMVDDIITALSRFKALFVIARNSSFTYKGRAVDVKQVGRELGVRYMLEGSVRKAANRVRITGQLVDTSAGAHLWADRFEGEIEDIFDLQDRVTQQVVGAIAPEIDRAEMERASRRTGGSIDAVTETYRGLPHIYWPTNPENNDAAFHAAPCPLIGAKRISRLVAGTPSVCSFLCFRCGTKCLAARSCENDGAACLCSRTATTRAKQQWRCSKWQRPPPMPLLRPGLLKPPPNSKTKLASYPRL